VKCGDTPAGIRPGAALASYGFVMDFALSSSTVLGAAVLLWLLWGAPYLLRKARPASDASVLLSEESEAVLRPSHLPMPPARTFPEPARQSPEEGLHVSNRSSGAGRLRIRWGRCVLALVGVAGLLLAIVGGVLAAVLVVRPAIPLAGLAATVLAVVVLRRLAVRDRRRRSRVRPRTSTPTQQPVPQRASAPRAATEVFNHQPEPEPAAPSLSREDLRAAALEVARAAQAAAAEAASESGDDEGSTWEPVDVPKPSYMDAAKAEREAPEPIETPEEPKPAGKVTIKPKPQPGEASGVPTVPGARPAARGALGNLDAVLQRRRA
jgi:hypothetical protein